MVRARHETMHDDSFHRDAYMYVHNVVSIFEQKLTLKTGQDFLDMQGVR